MNPPSSSPTAARSAAVPPFRSFVTVELPFTLSPGISSEISTAEKKQVEAFLPPSFVVDCVQKPVPQLSSFRPEDTMAKRTRLRSQNFNVQDAELLHGNYASDDSASHHSGSSNDSDDGDSGNDDDVGNTQGDGRVARGAAKKGGSGTQKPAVRLMTGRRRDYCADPIFNGWRSTNWEDAVDDDDAAGSAETHLPPNPKRQRRDVFPSIEPQVLVNGYYRNDLLVQVRRTRRVRRYRDPATNTVLREEYVEEEDGHQALEREVGPSSTPALTTEVIGVVSRELEIARPADFTFALFTADQLRAAPSLCGADFFPPAHFLSDKSCPEARYEPGKERNTSLWTDEMNAAVAAPASEEGDGSADVGQRSRSAVVPQSELGPLPALTVGAVESATALPTRLAVHEQYLRALPSSLDGNHDDDPPEVRMMVQLLAERPAWIMQDLMEAMMQTGLCPRGYRNKQVMSCYTYFIPTGPFNRLRLRLGFDPYANSSYAMYERIAVRVHRLTDLGVRLRDVWRSPYIENVLRLLLSRDRPRRLAYKAQPGHKCRSTMLELQCRAIREGLLVLPFQLIDAMDDPVIADIVRHASVVDAPMEPSQRTARCGWLSEAAFTRAATHFTESLAALLEQEVEPLLRKFKGEDDTTHPQKTNPADEAPRKAAEAAEDEDDDVDDDDDDSAMSSATAGDLSSDGEEDVGE